MSVRSETVQLELRPEELEHYRRELTAYCYRMLGSLFETDDAVQETMVRAWRGAEGFEGRSSVRSWLYRIATNVCLDMLRGRQRRARPMELGPASTTAAFTGEKLPKHAWVEPMPDERILPTGRADDPAEQAASRESVRLAFIAALQYLPARQRAVLILREVLRWPAAQVAELLNTSVASVNSALQRARATMATTDLDADAASARVVDPDQQELVAQYVDAFVRFDVSRLVTLLQDDVVQTMPPYVLWLRGQDEVGQWLSGPGSGCRGSRLLATAANGCTAFGQYRSDGQGGYQPWAVQVIEVNGDRISALHNFVDPDLFAAFGLPPELP